MTRPFVTSRSRALVLALLAAVLAFAAWQFAQARTATPTAEAAAGVTINMQVTGQKTGVFKADDNSRQIGVIAVTGYQSELVVPRDAATGMASGRRQWKPIVVTHVVGGSSPEFLNSAATNEILTKVVINFYRTDRFGREVNYFRVTLTNAALSDVREYSAGTDVLEDDSFVFQKIDVQDLVAHTEFIDNVVLNEA